ncbi:MAG: GGDEF domain-containing protein [Lachnospiraceae bacterium]|nr:GGDEF domain-containing protein [Lachnospiraceae bacterium]
MDTVIISADIVSAMFLLIILPGLYRVTPEVAEKTKYYRYCIWLCLFGSMAKVLSFIFNGVFNGNLIISIVNYYAYIFIDLMIAFFAFYLYTLIKEKEQKISSRFTGIVIALCVIDFLLRTVGSYTGKLFTVRRGVVAEGPWHPLIAIAPALCFICIFILLICEAKKLGIRYTLALGMYLFLPSAAAIVQIYAPKYAFGYLASALALMIIYVMIQSEIIAEANVRAKLYNRLSTKDVLTGLKNRRGYQEMLAEINEGERVGVLFSDINSLKFVNDQVGHDAGDRLIQSMAAILNEFFPDAEPCRISGDEFVVVVKDPDEKEFEERMKKLSKAFFECDRIASMGYEIGNGKDVQELINSAERMMYQDKKRYYEETGRDRRR